METVQFVIITNVCKLITEYVTFKRTEVFILSPFKAKESL